MRELARSLGDVKKLKGGQCSLNIGRDEVGGPDQAGPCRPELSLDFKCKGKSLKGTEVVT